MKNNNLTLPNWTEDDAEITGDFRDDMSHERYLAQVVVDVFEDFLV